MKWYGMDWIDLAQDMEGFCKHGNGTSSSTIYWGVVD
jgi:hypothetical protein